MTEVNRDINKLSGDFKLKVIDFLEEVGDIIFITEGFRTQERQDELYEQGRTTPGNIVTWTKYSNHQDGLAIDIAFKGDELYPEDPDKWKHIGKIANKYGIDWGYDLWGNDKPHFQDNGEPYRKQSMEIFGKDITIKGLTFPSSIYGIPVAIKSTDSDTLVGYASIKGYAPRSKKDEIFIFDNTFKKGEMYVKKVLFHEAFHFFQHLVFSDNQNKYLEDLFKFIPDYVSDYAKTMHWEDSAETFAYGETYIKDDELLPRGKIWNDAIGFKYDACKKFVNSRIDILTKLIEDRA